MRTTKIILLIIIGSLTMASVRAQTVENEAIESECVESGNAFKMLRGLGNVGTCFLELPRCIVYYNSDLLIYGMVQGVITGTGLCAIRAFSGVMDMATLGFGDNPLYNTENFGEFVWDSPWI